MYVKIFRQRKYTKDFEDEINEYLEDESDECVIHTHLLT